MNIVVRIAKHLLFFIILIVVFFSCSKVMSVDKPDFEVSVQSTTVKKGDSVIFKLTGNPDIITFYSGEMGNDYAYINEDRILPTKKINLSFQSQVRTQGGTAGYCQAEQFHILISDDLTFASQTQADSVNAVKNATWKNITDSFTLSPLECNSTTPYVASREADISKLIPSGKRFNVAFRYTNESNAVKGNATIWRFSTFNMTAVTELSSVVVANQANAGWKPVFIGEGWTSAAFTNSGSVVTLRGLVTNTAHQEMWCIANGVTITDKNLGNEFGVGIKSMQETSLKSYGHKFTKAGKYIVTFVALNANADNREETVRQIEITVEP